MKLAYAVSVHKAQGSEFPVIGMAVRNDKVAQRFSALKMRLDSS